MKREAVYTLLFIFAAGFLWQLGCELAEVAVERSDYYDKKYRNSF